MAAGRIGWQVAAWALLVALQVWSLKRIARLEARLAASHGGAPGMAATGEPPPPTPMEAAMAASLARIESRLAAGAGQPAMAAAPVARREDPAPAMPPEVADARLATLLPAGGTLRDAELAALQGRIDRLPATERQAVALALARAINAGRIRVVP